MDTHIFLEEYDSFLRVNAESEKSSQHILSCGRQLLGILGKCYSMPSNNAKYDIVAWTGFILQFHPVGQGS